MKRAVIASLIALIPSLSRLTAQEPQPPPPPAVVGQFLGFSDTQAARFQQLLHNLQAAMAGLEEQMRTRQQVLESLLGAAQADAAPIGALLLEIRALQKQGGQAFQAYHEGFLALLTPEQKEKAQAVAQSAQLLPAVRAFAAVRLIEPPQ